MLCDRCKKNEANVHVTRIVNGVKYEQNLCSECAAQHGATDMSFGNSGLEQLMQFFRHLGMVGVVVTPRDSYMQPDLDELGLHLPGSQEANEHARDIDSLRAELSSCVAQEKFERAAELRDEIFTLEKELEAQS